MAPETAPNGDQDRITDTAACHFRPSKPPWPAHMCALCGEWLDNHRLAGVTTEPARSVRRD